MKQLLLVLTAVLFGISAQAQNAAPHEHFNNESADEKKQNHSTMDIGQWNVEDKISVYPNPVINVFNLDTEIIRVADITLYDLKGAVRGKYKYNSTDYKEGINIGHFPTGFYVVEIIADNKVYRKQILKK